MKDKSKIKKIFKASTYTALLLTTLCFSTFPETNSMFIKNTDATSILNYKSQLEKIVTSDAVINLQELEGSTPTQVNLGFSLDTNPLVFEDDNYSYSIEGCTPISQRFNYSALTKHVDANFTCPVTSEAVKNEQTIKIYIHETIEDEGVQYKFKYKTYQFSLKGYHDIHVPEDPKDECTGSTCSNAYNTTEDKQKTYEKVKTWLDKSICKGITGSETCSSSQTKEVYDYLKAKGLDMTSESTFTTSLEKTPLPKIKGLDISTNTVDDDKTITFDTYNLAGFAEAYKNGDYATVLYFSENLYSKKELEKALRRYLEDMENSETYASYFHGDSDAKNIIIRHVLSYINDSSNGLPIDISPLLNYQIPGFEKMSTTDNRLRIVYYVLDSAKNYLQRDTNYMTIYLGYDSDQFSKVFRKLIEAKSSVLKSGLIKLFRDDMYPDDIYDSVTRKNYDTTKEYVDYFILNDDYDDNYQPIGNDKVVVKVVVDKNATEKYIYFEEVTADVTPTFTNTDDNLTISLKYENLSLESVRNANGILEKIYGLDSLDKDKYFTDITWDNPNDGSNYYATISINEKGTLKEVKKVTLEWLVDTENNISITIPKADILEFTDLTVVSIPDVPAGDETQGEEASAGDEVKALPETEIIESMKIDQVDTTPIEGALNEAFMIPSKDEVAGDEPPIGQEIEVDIIEVPVTDNKEQEYKDEIEIVEEPETAE